MAIKYPSVHSNTLKVCALLLYDLKSGQMCDILKLAKHTVENMRTDLRKVIKRDYGEHLNSHLRKFSLFKLVD
ncbi:MAG: hypothetical protein WCH46_00375 [bacterium]